MESVFYVVTLHSGDYFQFDKKGGEQLSFLLNKNINEEFVTLKDEDGDVVALRLSSIISIKQETFRVLNIEKDSDQRYHQKQLIDFGNYLLSAQRTNSIAENISEIPIAERLKKVTDADLQNFFNK